MLRWCANGEIVHELSESYIRARGEHQLRSTSDRTIQVGTSSDQSATEKRLGAAWSRQQGKSKHGVMCDAKIVPKKIPKYYSRKISSI